MPYGMHKKSTKKKAATGAKKSGSGVKKGTPKKKKY